MHACTHHEQGECHHHHGRSHQHQLVGVQVERKARMRAPQLEPMAAMVWQVCATSLRIDFIEGQMAYVFHQRHIPPAPRLRPMLI